MAEAKPGQYTFVLVPGAGGQAWYWHRVVPELERCGHTALALDLPADDDSADLDAYADAVAAATVGYDRIVLVAQSMGALCAPLVCERRPVSLLVLVNGMIPLPRETGHDWWVVTGQPQAAEALAVAQGRSTQGLDAEEVFFHDVPVDVVRAAMQAGELTQSGTPFTQPFPLAQWPDVPTRVVVSTDDRLFPLEFQRRVAMERLGIRPDEIPGGHLVALSRPVALAAHLEATAREVLGSG